jgi:hypothetical protein
MTRSILQRIFVLAAVLACCASAAPAQSVNCQQGYVWRQAFPGDLACVSPLSRDQAAADNAAADSRRAAPGSDTCIQGYVWRGANIQDHVCVTPEVRRLTAVDNGFAPKRILPQLTSEIGASPSAATDSEDFILQKGHEIPGFHLFDPPQELVNLLEGTDFQPVNQLTIDELNRRANQIGIKGTKFVFDAKAAVTGFSFDLEGGSRSESHISAAMLAPSTIVDGTGVVQIFFTAVPHRQYILDCLVDGDDKYTVDTRYITQNKTAPWYLGVASSQKHDLLIPFAPAPDDAQSAVAAIQLKGQSLSLGGCQIYRSWP